MDTTANRPNTSDLAQQGIDMNDKIEQWVILDENLNYHKIKGMPHGYACHSEAWTKSMLTVEAATNPGKVFYVVKLSMSAMQSKETGITEYSQQ